MNTDRYLGDGVYASFDGFRIWLAVNNRKNKVVALEEDVMDALIRYNNDLKEFIKSKNENENENIDTFFINEERDDDKRKGLID